MAQSDAMIESGGQLIPLPFMLFTSYVGNICIGPGHKSGMDWCTIILHKNENDEEKSLAAFFKLYDEFRQLNVIKCYRTIFNNDNIQHHNTAYEATKIITSDNKTIPVYSNPIDAYIIELSNNTGFIYINRTSSGRHLNMWIEPTRHICETEIKRNFGDLGWQEIEWNERLNNALGFLIDFDRHDKHPIAENSDKEKIVNKYGLFLENGGWYSQKENSHKHLIFKNSFYQKQDIIGLLFRINKLCMAKVKYFRQNIDDFEPFKYNYKNGFIKTELWDSEFLKHIASGYMLDYRFLQSITVYSDFVNLCNELECYCQIPQCSKLDD